LVNSVNYETRGKQSGKCNNINEQKYSFLIITNPTTTLKLLIILTIFIAGSILSSLLISPSSMIAYSQTPEQALTSPLSSSSSLSSPIPGLLPPLQPPSSSQSQQQPAQSEQIQTSVPAAAPPTEGLTANGTIDSLIFAPGTRWIATGNWSMVLRNGNINSFNTNMIWYNTNGTKTHTHEFLNFKPSGAAGGGVAGDIITVKPGDNILMKGLMDVGTNHRITWKNVNSIVDIKEGKTISISLDDKETDKHFAGQTIYGIVKSLTRCSDRPGPNMEVLEPCITFSAS
jgi:hypothetical protein